MTGRPNSLTEIDPAALLLMADEILAEDDFLPAKERRRPISQVLSSNYGMRDSGWLEE